MLLSKEYEEHLKLVAQSMENPEKDISGVETSASVAPTTKSILSTKLIEPLWLTNAPGAVRNMDSERPRRASIQLDQEIFSVSFSPDSELLIGTCGNGDIRVWGVDSSREKMTLRAGGMDNYPVMCARWRPFGSLRNSTSSSTTKNILLTAGGDGRLIHWHVPSGKALSEIWTPDNSLYACDFSCNSSRFASAGKDGVIRVYDEQTKQLVSEHHGGRAPMAAGHSLTVFAMKFHTTEPNLAVSAGWDNSVQLWDLRAGERAVNSIRGVEIRGEGLDISQDGRSLLIANTRSKYGLQIADFNSFNIIQNIEWRNRRPTTSTGSDISNQSGLNVSGVNDRTHGNNNDNVTGGVVYNPPLYSAKFSKDDASSMILAGGGGNGVGVENEALLFDRRILKNMYQPIEEFAPYDPQGYSVVQYGCSGQISGLQRSVYSVDIANNFSKLAVASADGVVRVLKMTGF